MDIDRLEAAARECFPESAQERIKPLIEAVRTLADSGDEPQYIGYALGCLGILVAHMCEDRSWTVTTVGLIDDAIEDFWKGNGRWPLEVIEGGDGREEPAA